MHRFFVSPENITGNIFTLTGSDVRHIGRVLRLGPGDRVTLVAGDGTEYCGELTAVDGTAVKGVIRGQTAADAEPRLRLTLYQGLPKAAKMDYIIQKGTEIGLSRIVPVATERAVVKLAEERAAGKTERWQKIAGEAAKQAGRAICPTVAAVMPLGEALAEAAAANDLTLIPWERAAGRSLKQALRAAGDVRRIGIFIGPEGGFSEAEAEKAAKSGAVPVSLGPRILRTETAGLVTAALVLYELDDMGGAVT